MNTLDYKDLATQWIVLDERQSEIYDLAEQQISSAECQEELATIGKKMSELAMQLDSLEQKDSLTS